MTAHPRAGHPGGLRWGLAIGLACLATAPAGAQEGIATAAAAARSAWEVQRAPGVIGEGARILLQLPGSGSRSSVSREQAVRLLEGLFRRAEEVEVRVTAAREVAAGQGYAELLRRYRVSGTSEERSQRVLLAYRWDRGRGGWVLVELRVLEAGG